MWTKDELLDTRIFDNNEYLDKYITLIDLNKNNTKQKYTNIHHIIPRCYYKINHLDVDNSDKNTVVLNYHDHILAHYYLYKACKTGIELKHLLGSTVYQLTKEFKDIDTYTEPEFISNLTEYETLHKEFILADSGKNNPFYGHSHSTDSKLKMSLSLTGKKATLETKEKLSKSHIGLKRTDETKAKMSLVQKGRKMCYDTDGVIHYFNPNLGEIMPEGCTLGMPEWRKKVAKEKSQEYFSEHSQWNTGLKTADEVKQKISISNKGKVRSNETKEKLSKSLTGKPHRPHTQEEKQHISEKSKGRIWIHNEFETKLIWPAELDYYTELGFQRGRH